MRRLAPCMASCAVLIGLAVLTGGCTVGWGRSEATPPPRLPGHALPDVAPRRGWADVGVVTGEPLLVHRLPGDDSIVVGRLAPAVFGIRVTGRRFEYGGQTWVQIAYGGLHGWVRRTSVAPVGAARQETTRFRGLPPGRSPRALAVAVAADLSGHATGDLAGPLLVRDRRDLVVVEVRGLSGARVEGDRVEVRARHVPEGYAVDQVWLRPICTRGLTAAGDCA